MTCIQRGIRNVYCATRTPGDDKWHSLSVPIAVVKYLRKRKFVRTAGIQARSKAEYLKKLR